MRLRTQIIILVGGMVLMPVLVSAILLFFRSIGDAGREPVANFVTVTEWIRHGLSDIVEKGDYERIPAELPAPAKILVFGDNNQVAYSNIAAFPAGATPSLDRLFSFVRRDSRSFHVQWETIGLDDGGERIVLLEIPRPPGPPGARIRPFYVAIIISASLLAFAILVSGWIVRSLTRSILRLENATRNIAEGNLEFELNAKGNNEVASLTRSFDAMRNALKGEYARRSRFIMGVSHDLKTPLSLIEGYAEAISDGYARDPETQQRYLSIIRDKARALENMVNRLIDFAKLETGEWKSQHRPVALRAFLDEIGRRYYQDAGVLRRTFSYEIDIDAALEVVMDEDLAMRAIENLLGNAFRYSPENGTVTLTAHESAESVTIAIHDSGPGIGQAELAYIFDPFYRGTGSRREEGTGLGLAIVKSVIESHGWRIAVDQSSDAAAAGSPPGATFRIVIPRRA